MEPPHCTKLPGFKRWKIVFDWVSHARGETLIFYISNLVVQYVIVLLASMMIWSIYNSSTLGTI